MNGLTSDLAESFVSSLRLCSSFGREKRLEFYSFCTISFLGLPSGDNPHFMDALRIIHLVSYSWTCYQVYSFTKKIFSWLPSIISSKRRNQHSHPLSFFPLTFFEAFYLWAVVYIGRRVLSTVVFMDCQVVKLWLMCYALLGWWDENLPDIFSCFLA